MKIGSGSGVRAEDAGPEMIYTVSSLRRSSRACPISTSISFLACSRYGRSGLGGMGPLYFSSEHSHVTLRSNKHKVLVPIVSIFPPATSPQPLAPSPQSGAFFHRAANAQHLGFIDRLGQHKAVAALECARQIGIETIGEQDKGAHLITHPFEKLHPVQAGLADRAQRHVESHALHQIHSLLRI